MFSSDRHTRAEKFTRGLTAFSGLIKSVRPLDLNKSRCPATGNSLRIVSNQTMITYKLLRRQLAYTYLTYRKQFES